MYKRFNTKFRMGLLILTIFVLVCTQFSFVETTQAAQPNQEIFPDDPPPLLEQKDQPGTPMQASLKETIDQRKELGLPVPSSISFEYDINSGQVLDDSGLNSDQETEFVIAITSKTVVHFDHPEQAG